MTTTPPPSKTPAPPKPAERHQPFGLPLAEQLRFMKRLAPLLWPKGEFGLRVRVVVAFILVIAAKLINITVPIFYKHAVDDLSGKVSPAISIPVALIVAYSVARVLAQTSGELRDWIFARVAQRAVRMIALQVLSHLHHLSLRFHFDRQTGGLNRALDRGAAGIEFLLGYLLYSVAPIALEIGLVAAVMWRLYNVSFAAATLATILVYVYYTARIVRWRVKFRREMNTADNEASSRSLDSLLNYETVKYFSNEAHELARFDESKMAYFNASLRNQGSLSILNIGQGAILAVGLGVVMVLAGQGIVAGRMSIGDFVLVNSYLLQLYVPLGNLGNLYRNLRQSLTDVETMYRLLGERSEVQDKPEASALAVGPGRIAFEHVSFAYDRRRTVVDDVSFEIPAGKTVALVGPTGSGKTTIGRLLFRFYDPASGRISVDGQDIRDVTQESLRRIIGVVPQDTVLFNDTLYYNIAYGKPDATRAEVEEATRLAHLEDFVRRLPDGFDTRVGERGLKLSGGEKQRVAIARVILKRPRILLFDEATSALDTRTERDIQASLRDVSTHHTTLVITHRLTTVVDADEILVFDQGRIIERGTHEGLLAQEGLYATMWNRQIQEDGEGVVELEEVGS